MKKIILATTILFYSFTSNGENLNEETVSFVEQNELACISEGIKQKTNHRPSDRYLSLLAAIAYQNADLPNKSGTTNRNIRVNDELKQSIQKRIIENIQAFGFCIENKIDSKGLVSQQKGYAPISTYKHDSAEDIRMMFVSEYKSSDRAKNKVANDYFGFNSFHAMNNLFYTKDWNHKTQKQRQDFFRDKLASAIKEPTNYSRSVASSAEYTFAQGDLGEAAKECVKQLEGWTKPENNTIFNHSKGAVPSENVALCKTISKECGFKNDNFCEGKLDAPSVHMSELKQVDFTDTSLFAAGKNKDSSERLPSSTDGKK